MLRIRRERPDDYAAVRQVHEQAFARPAEADLVDALRMRGKAALFLVAVVAGRIVLAAVHEDTIVGSVQLELASMPNALHRAEVQKLVVLRSQRRLACTRPHRSGPCIR
jgi:hypothetical protein